MNAFHAGFTHELLKLADSQALRKLAGIEDAGQKAGVRIGRLAGGGVALGGLNKLMNPDVPISEAMASGLAVYGGGNAGEAVAKRFKRGPVLQLAGGLAGAMLANKLVRSITAKRREERARGEVFDKESGVKDILRRLLKPKPAAATSAGPAKIVRGGRQVGARSLLSESNDLLPVRGEFAARFGTGSPKMAAAKGSLARAIAHKFGFGDITPPPAFTPIQVTRRR